MRNVSICILRVSEEHACMPNYCALRRLCLHILPYCSSTATRVIQEIGSISWATLQPDLPSPHLTAAVRRAYPKITAGSLATHSTGILFVDWTALYGVRQKSCSSGRSFSIQPNSPRLLWRCL